MVANDELPAQDTNKKNPTAAVGRDEYSKQFNSSGGTITDK